MDCVWWLLIYEKHRDYSPYMQISEPSISTAISTAVDVSLLRYCFDVGENSVKLETPQSYAPFLRSFLSLTEVS